MSSAVNNLGTFDPNQYKNNGTGNKPKQRMAGQYMEDFAEGNASVNYISNYLGNNAENLGQTNSNNNYSKDYRGNSSNSSTNSSSAGNTNSNSNTNNSSASNSNPAPASKSPVQPTDNEYVPNFQGGVAGEDYPDPNNGSVIVNSNGTMSQTTADGQQIEWGKEEALQSAIQAKQDAKASVQNYREINYDTNLPSDFDPGGKDQLAHNQYLCSLTGAEIFCGKANHLQSSYGSGAPMANPYPASNQTANANSAALSPKATDGAQKMGGSGATKVGGGSVKKYGGGQVKKY